MKNTGKKALNQEIDKQIEKATSALSAAYPRQDVEYVLNETASRWTGY
jgi:hypothetical protein